MNSRTKSSKILNKNKKNRNLSISNHLNQAYSPKGQLNNSKTKHQSNKKTNRGINSIHNSKSFEYRSIKGNNNSPSQSVIISYPKNRRNNNSSSSKSLIKR